MPQDAPKNLKKKRNRELRAYFREVARNEGFFAAIGRTLRYFRRRHGSRRGRYWPAASVLATQRAANFEGWPRLSILVPVYNPQPRYFEEMLASVQKQTYPGWQLCIADASDDAATYQAMAEQYADERIVYQQVPNEGIAANTNRAAAAATGQYLLLLDHDDVLSPDALYEMAENIIRTKAGFLYSDEALFTDDVMLPTAGHFKPDYSPQYLLNVNYIAHLVAIRRDIFTKLGGLRSECDGAQDHDLFLRVLEETGGAEHIRKVLYYWRQHPQSTSTGVDAKPYVADAAKKAIADHLERTGVRGRVVDGLFPSTYKVDYDIRGLPLVSVIIPNNEHIADLDRCIRTLYAKTSHRHFEVLVVENGSKTVDTFNYYQKLTATYPECKVLVYEEQEDFNFSKVCNFGRRHARGEYLLFLNNDTEVINNGWMGEMLQLCQLDDVGAVGAMLYYPDDTIQHAGVITGLGGYAGHSHKYARRGASGYMFRAACVQEVSAVTGAAMMVRRRAFDDVGGFDEGFAVAYNDVDFCLRLREKGWWVLFTPYAELYHYESKSRGSDEEGPAKARFEAEQQLLLGRYGDALRHDAFYSPWLTSDREDFTESDAPPVID
ncbi:glycosyltransferase family 2 protein [Ruminococcaceae bacterium OttesenSCG-928-O06]|nr:glycosyltransferase family 2 protein [Ruminococcaceae bacterium OttesenSCG-928-O06]